MRKYIICLITLIGLTLTGCGEKETGATMIWEKDGFKVTVSTTEDAIVVPENCNMRSVDGFVVKVVDGEKSRTLMKQAMNLGNLSCSVQPDGTYVYTATYQDYSGDVQTEEIDYIMGLPGVDLTVVISASGDIEHVIDVERLIAFINTLKMGTKGDYTPYNWETFLNTAKEEREAQHVDNMNKVIDDIVSQDPSLAQQALGKDKPETQEDYDKIIEYSEQVNENEEPEEVGETHMDFNFFRPDSDAIVFALGNTLDYTYADNSYISTDGKFVLQTGLEENSEKAVDLIAKFSDSYTKYKVDDTCFVAINESILDSVLLFDAGNSIAKVSIKAKDSSASYDDLVNVLSYINTMRLNNLYTFSDSFAREANIEVGYKYDEVEITPITLEAFTVSSTDENKSSDEKKEEEVKDEKANKETKE